MNARQPRFRIRLLHVAVLSALSFAHPLFGTLVGNPLFFLVRRADAVELWAVAVAALLVPAALLTVIECAAHRMSQRAGWKVHVALVGALIALISLPAFDRVAWWAAVAGPLGTGIAVGYGYARWPPVALATTYLSPALIVVPSLFLARAPVPPWRWGAHRSAPDMISASLHPDAVRRPLSIAMLVLDELPLVTLLDEAGRLDRIRYPNFASLEGDALWVRDTTADASHTHRALPALMSGRLPDASRPYDSRRAPSLFQVLARTHVITASEPLLKLCPDSICDDGGPAPAWRRMGTILRDAAVVQGWLFAPQPLRAVLPTPVGLLGSFGRAGIARAHGDSSVESDAFDDPATLRQQLAAWRRDASGRPTLHFAHVMLPHQPFVFLPSGQRYRDGDDRIYAAWESDDVALEYHRRHSVQAAYADAVLRMFIERVKSLGIWNDGIVVITADHGIGFVPGSHPRLADERNVGEVAWIPLFIRAPGIPRGAARDTQASTVDVAATILDLLDARPSFPIDGRSVLQARSSPRERRIVNDTGGVVQIEPSVEPLEAALARKIAHVGAGSFEQAFRSGRGSDVMLRSVEELPTGEPAVDVEVSITNLAQYDDVDPSGAKLPALISGTVVSGRRPVELAVALNGRIGALQAVARAGVLTSARGWRAFLPWMLLRAGKNDVEVFEVDRTTGAARLRAVRLRPDRT
jgi:hypothetical protein